MSVPIKDPSYSLIPIPVVNAFRHLMTLLRQHVHDGSTVLGLGGAAYLNVGTVAGTVAAGDDSRFTGDVHTQYIPKALLTQQGDIIYASAAATPAALVHADAGDLLQSGGHGANPSWIARSGIDHGVWGGQTNDNHTQYALLAGRVASQDLAGGTETAGEMIIRGTAHADNNGPIRLNPNGGKILVGAASASTPMLMSVAGPLGCYYAIYREGSGQQAFIVDFANGVANQKVDLIIGSTWAGILEIVVGSGYNYANACGVVGRTFLLSLADGGGSSLNLSWYNIAHGYMPDHFAIGPCTWDAANSRWRIQFIHRATSGNTLSITVRGVWYGNDNTAIFCNMNMSDVYTTDGTVFSAPVVNLPYNIGLGIVPTARLHLAAGTTVAGTAPAKLTSGPLLDVKEPGAIEFLTDAVYFTITTGAVRKTLSYTHIIDLSFLAVWPGAVWTDMPAAVTDLYGSSLFRRSYDCTNLTQVRIGLDISVAGVAGSVLAVQFWTGSAWTYLDESSGPSASIAAAGHLVSAWVNLTAAAKASITMKLVGSGGNAAADPAFTQIYVQFQ